MAAKHKHYPGDFCFVRSDELREALGAAYAASVKHNLWWVLRKIGPELYLSHLLSFDLLTDAFRSVAFRDMTYIAIHGWDAFVKHYEAETRKPRQPCLLDGAGAGACSNKHLYDE